MYPINFLINISYCLSTEIFLKDNTNQLFFLSNLAYVWYYNWYIRITMIHRDFLKATHYNLCKIIVCCCSYDVPIVIPKIRLNSTSFCKSRFLLMNYLMIFLMGRLIWEFHGFYIIFLWWLGYHDYSYLVSFLSAL